MPEALLTNEISAEYPDRDTSGTESMLSGKALKSIGTHFSMDRDHSEEDEGPPTRHCTDPGCLMVFFIYYGVMAYILYFAVTNGNIDKVTHGFDWTGDICGVDSKVVNSSYLYWCSSDGMTLSDPICVESCPTRTTNKGQHKCPGEPTMQDNSVTNSDETETRSITITRKLEFQEDLVTENILNYCLPTKEKDLMVKILDQTVVSGYSKQLYMALSSIQEGRKFLIGVTIVAVFFGYAFLFILKKFIKPFILTLFTFVWVSLIGLASWGYYVGQLHPGQDANPFYGHMVPEDADRCATVIGCVCLFLWFFFTCFWCYARTAIATTCESVEKACEAIVSMPTLLLQPLIQISVQLTCLAVMIYGLLWIISLGHVTTSSPWPDPGMGLPVDVKGVKRSFTFSQYQWYMLAFWGFGVIWLYEIISAAGQYAISHAVVVRSHMKHPPRCFPLLRGYANGISYHLGTLAFGAFVIGVLKFATAILAWLAKQINSPDKKVNVAARACLCCCTCCLGCLTQVMKLVNEMVYVDCAMFGHNYLAAAWHVWKLSALNPVTTVTVLACVKVIGSLGVLTIGGLGTFCSYWILSNPGRITSFFSNDISKLTAAGAASGYGLDAVDVSAVTNALYTSNVWGMTIMSGCIFVCVAIAFMNTFVMAAQTNAYVITAKAALNEQD